MSTRIPAVRQVPRTAQTPNKAIFPSLLYSILTGWDSWWSSTITKKYFFCWKVLSLISFLRLNLKGSWNTTSPGQRAYTAAGEAISAVPQLDSTTAGSSKKHIKDKSLTGFNSDPWCKSETKSQPSGDGLQPITNTFHFKGDPKFSEYLLYSS